MPKFRVDKRSVRDHVGNLVYKHKKLQAEEKATGITPDCTQVFNQQRNIPLFNSEIGFTLGWVFIREGKLFIRRVRKTKITRPIYFGKQNKLFFACDLFYQKQTEHFLDFLKWCHGYDFRRKKCLRITLRKSVSELLRLASRLGSSNAAETDESIISNKFAQYFTNIASTIGGNHVLDLSEEDHKNHTSINAIRKEKLDIDFEFQPITEHDLNEELASINTKKPPGWDSVIPLIVFKEISHAISLSLQSIFNQCIEDCSWPSRWKMGECRGHQCLRRERDN